MTTDAYTYSLSMWNSDTLQDVPCGEVVMCHTHRQMFIDPQFCVTSVELTANKCPFCQENERGIAEIFNNSIPRQKPGHLWQLSLFRRQNA